MWRVGYQVPSKRKTSMYVATIEGFGNAKKSPDCPPCPIPSLDPCSKEIRRRLTVPFRSDLKDFLRQVCCAIGRFTIFRRDKGYRAWCHVERNRSDLESLHRFLQNLGYVDGECVTVIADNCVMVQKGQARVERVSIRGLLGADIPPSQRRMCRPSSRCTPSDVCCPFGLTNPGEYLRPGEEAG